MKLLEVIAPLRFSDTKLTSTQVKQVETVPLMGILQSPMIDGSDALMERWMAILIGNRLNPTKWPKPLVHMNELESNPGIWMVKDPAGFEFYIFSDEHRKNAFKGTSVQVFVPPKLRTSNDTTPTARDVIHKLLRDSIVRLFDFLVDASR